MFNFFKCQNSTCGETWSVNDKNQLVPGIYEQNGWSGGWQQQENSQDCPSCSDNWKWEEE